MMYRLIIALLMFLFMASPRYSQSFRDNNNMLLGQVESDGTVRNANKHQICSCVILLQPFIM